MRIGILRTNVLTGPPRVQPLSVPRERSRADPTEGLALPLGSGKEAGQIVSGAG
jgi:hypothetical protein